MKIIFNSLLKQNNYQIIRNLFTSFKCNGYEGPGKTTVHFLSKTAKSLLIHQCCQDGFVLNNDTKVIGPVAIFPRNVFYWNVGTANDINRASLSLFFVLDPKPDLVVIGLETSYDLKFINNIRAIFREENIPLEILPVRTACAAFNIVCEEGRFVAGAFIPPKEASVPKIIEVVEKAQNQLKEDAKFRLK